MLCLGYRGEMIREYFLHYNECLSNDFTLSNGGDIDLYSRDLDDWRITFVDTGLHSNIGQRLLRVRKYLAGEETFLANYSDGLSDLPLDTMIEDFRRKNVVASFAAVKPSTSFHAVHLDNNGMVADIAPLHSQHHMVNGGYFVLRQEIFDHIQEGEELVEQPFRRLIEKKQLGAYEHPGFWQAMDTFKDKITFDRMESRGDCPWMVWR